MSEGQTRIMIAILALVAGAAATAAVTGNPVNTSDRTTIEKIVREYILKNPEILLEAQDELQQRQTAKAVNANRAAIETPFAGAWEGAANSDVTVVQFFDYNCGYCRTAMADIDRLLREDKRVRVVYREFPVLGPASDKAARIGLAAAKAGKYPAVHRALYAVGKSDADVERLAREQGIDLAYASGPSAKAEIDANLNLARPLNISGTPAWVVGDQVLMGNVGYEAIKEAIVMARAR